MRYISLFFFWIFAFFAYQINQLIVVMDRANWFKSKFPKDLDSLADNKGWCVEQLQKSEIIPIKASIQSVNIEAINASEIFRSDTAIITIQYEHENEKQEAQALIKFSPSSGDVKNRAVFNLQQNHVKEVNYYKFLSAKIKENTPIVYGASFDLFTGNSYILIEYIAMGKAFNEIEGCPEDELINVVETFATFHGSFWGLKNNEVFGIAAIPAIIADFFESTCWRSWSKNTKKVFQMNWKHMNVQQTLIHGDSRIGNILFDKNGIVQLIDWQAARISKGAYDLAYFLLLSLPIHKRKQHEETLTKAYYKALPTTIQEEYSIESFRDDYKHACIMVITMLSIPWLSGEGSFDDESLTLVHFLVGHHFWINRLESKIQEFDLEWMAQKYSLSVNEAKTVLNEFLSGYQEEMERLKNSHHTIHTKFTSLISECKDLD